MFPGLGTLRQPGEELLVPELQRAGVSFFATLPLVERLHRAEVPVGGEVAGALDQGLEVGADVAGREAGERAEVEAGPGGGEGEVPAHDGQDVVAGLLVGDAHRNFPAKNASIMINIYI